MIEGFTMLARVFFLCLVGKNECRGDAGELYRTVVVEAYTHRFLSAL